MSKIITELEKFLKQTYNINIVYKPCKDLNLFNCEYFYSILENYKYIGGLNDYNLNLIFFNENISIDIEYNNETKNLYFWCLIGSTARTDEITTFLLAHIDENMLKNKNYSLKPIFEKIKQIYPNTK